MPVERGGVWWISLMKWERIRYRKKVMDNRKKGHKENAKGDNEGEVS
jgi:hypothetical protein